MQNKQNVSADLQGLNRLVTNATIGITDLVEELHRQIVDAPFLPSTPIQKLITNIAGITYNNIRWSTRLIGRSIDKLLGEFTVLGEIERTDKSEAIRSILNGVIGDFMEEKDNPLKITMQFRHQGKSISLNKKDLEKVYPNINGRILLMVHGSCMNDIQWTRNKHNHGTELAKELDKTPIFLHYNSGRHISTNGQNFNKLLEKLVHNWPLPVEELIIMGHSMGGLVTRSALHYGMEQQKFWTKHVKKIIFLGTPHHGASLERAGNYLEALLRAVPYSKPFAQLGKIRSAGITDLRYGNLVDEDWRDNNRFKLQSDTRNHIPLNKNIEYYCIAGNIRKTTDSVISKLVGDYLVDIKSALGQHKNHDRNLNFKQQNTWIADRCTHIDLLSDDGIYNKIKEWL